MNRHLRGLALVLGAILFPRAALAFTAHAPRAAVHTPYAPVRARASLAAPVLPSVRPTTPVMSNVRAPKPPAPLVLRAGPKAIRGAARHVVRFRGAKRS